MKDIPPTQYNVDTNSQKDSDNAYNALIKIGIKEVEFEDLEYKRLADLMVKPTYSPLVSEIIVKRRGDVRQAKLYHLRGLTGKAARIKEKI